MPPNNPDRLEDVQQTLTRDGHPKDADRVYALLIRAEDGERSCQILVEQRDHALQRIQDEREKHQGIIEHLESRIATLETENDELRSQVGV